MVYLIALAFIILILLGIIISSKEADDIEEQMRSYEEPESEALFRRLEFYREYVKKLDSWRNQRIITQEDWELERALVSERLDEIEREL